MQIRKFSLLLASFALAGSLSAVQANAQTASAERTVSNTANIAWDSGPNRLSARSNTVDIAVAPPSPQRPVITTYQFGDPPGAEQFSLPVTMCRASGGDRPVQLSGVFAGISTSPASLDPTTVIQPNRPVVFAIDAPQRNRDASVAEHFDIVITTPEGDSETIQVTETGPDSGRFAGMLNTASIPPQPVANDCTLSVVPGGHLLVEISDPQANSALGDVELDILVDPFGVVFDSADGVPVSGTRVTLIDVDTGQPAQVFGDDGVSAFPSTIVTGSTVTDAGGQSYSFTNGFYRFPFARPGRYRLVIDPPSPYSFPSIATPAQIAPLRRPDGQPFTIIDGSYGGIIVLDNPAPVRIDVPLDRPGTPLQLTKSVSAAVAVPGDVLQYRIVVRNVDPLRATGAVVVRDELPRELRLRPETVRIDGEIVAEDRLGLASDGSEFTVTIDTLAPGAQALVTYLTEVRPDANPGDIANLATATDDRGTVSNTAEAFTRIARDTLADKFTLIGRVTYGGCDGDPRGAKGIAGVRVMLEDGSFAITDAEGRYHFEGLTPQLHVVQIDPETLPPGTDPVDCAANTRSAGSAISRFVEGQGGQLKRADFRAKITDIEAAARALADQRKGQAARAIGDVEAAGAERDWFAGQTAGIAWLFPEEDHNPRVKALRVAIKHLPGQKVELSVNGKRVDPLNFDGARTSPDGSFLVSLWRGLEIQDRRNTLTARVVDENGKLVEELTRTVHYSGSPVKAVLVPEKSRLVANGIDRPVIAVRLTDRDGRPAHHGLTGAFSVPAPYTPAIEVDAQQAEQLSGLERAKPVWRVEGDEGIAYVELAPTSASGSLAIEFAFQDGDTRRTERLTTWLDPGDRPWTVVGFAAGTIGYNTLDTRLESIGDDDDSFNVDGRIALYAKGRILGKWLMTLAYDSDKERDETRFAGIIDPRSYYTIYADRSEQSYDAASIRRLYLRLERPQFYALFGDYETGIDEPYLARYQRSFNGVKAEFRNERVSATAFGADTPFRFRRVELQGNGLSGPYALGATDILMNSERIIIEVRDRLRSEQIVETRQLTRHIDYDIDYTAGTLRFREPILSRSIGGDPQFIIAEYEVDGIGKREINAGGRVTWQTADKQVQVGATAIHNADDRGNTELGGVDVRYRPDERTEVRAEVAVSDTDAAPGTTAQGGTAAAYLVEAQHVGTDIDALAYYRRLETGFGVGQINAAEGGTEKFGVDVRWRFQENWELGASGYQESFLDTGARRRAAAALVEYRTDRTSARIGLTHADDRLSDGRNNRSTIVTLGGSQRLFGNRLELDAQTEFALGGEDESIDFPSRHRIGARWSVNSWLKLLGAYEFAESDTFDAQTGRIGFEIAPWAGARFIAAANRQDISEFGPRTYASYGFAQSLQLSDRWSVDFSLDANQTLNGQIDPADDINPEQPVASGGFLGTAGAITEDFVAVTAGATYRHEDWSLATRAEYRAGELGDRYGITSAVLKQLGNGSTLGGYASYFHAESDGGPSTDTIDVEISWAHRPDDSRWAILDKVEFHEDKVTAAVFGQPGPIGGALLNVSGDVTSRRLINSMSINYTPVAENALAEGKAFFERGEYGLFWGTRYVFDRFGPDDLEGWSNVVGVDATFDLSDTLAVGGRGTVRIGTDGDTVAYSGGPVVEFSPARNSVIQFGYNFVGFDDRDFEDSRYTRSGPFLTFKLKFDQTTLAGLGLVK